MENKTGLMVAATGIVISASIIGGNLMNKSEQKPVEIIEKNSSEHLGISVLNKCVALNKGSKNPENCKAIVEKAKQSPGGLEKLAEEYGVKSGK
jgi:ABC-type Fe3+ transport system substrate-binding protein